MGEIIKSLIDPYGRRVRKLRVSLTDNCNLRCHYCMPVDSKFMEDGRLLNADEYFAIVEDLCSYGLEEVRLTGGEPLMRRSFTKIAEELSTLPLKKIGLTTNAVLLDRYLSVLKANRIAHLNISLDSLNPATYTQITHGNHLAKVLRNIELARAMDFNIKINVVAMKGINDHEVGDFVEYSKSMGIEVRFLELMRIGFACGSQKEQFISAQEIMDSMRLKYELRAQPVSQDSTSFNFETAGGGRIGFIASESKAFCGNCSRWRLSADGILRACLLKDDGISIKGVTLAERERIYLALLGMKPPMRPAEVAHQMNTIGG